MFITDNKQLDNYSFVIQPFQWLLMNFSFCYWTGTSWYWVDDSLMEIWYQTVVALYLKYVQQVMQ